MRPFFAQSPFPVQSPFPTRVFKISLELICFATLLIYVSLISCLSLVCQVLECCWADLKKQVAEASDLDHIVAAHETFLDQVLNRCLLDAESRVSHFLYALCNRLVRNVDEQIRKTNLVVTVRRC